MRQRKTVVRRICQFSRAQQQFNILSLNLRKRAVSHQALAASSEDAASRRDIFGSTLHEENCLRLDAMSCMFGAKYTHVLHFEKGFWMCV